MPAESTWETFFDAHAPVYDENSFTRNTAQDACHLDGR